jgi:hypothetical protein
VRELAPPLQVGELAFRAALRLLAAGDVFDRLRDRIHVLKPITVELLEALGLEVIGGHDDLPWVVVRDTGGAASTLLRQRGIRGLAPAPAPSVAGPSTELLHLSIPLSDERMAVFRRLVERQGA